ncbi:MAG: dTDP-4-dehydrorhamnose 3,5-epimerase [Clostridia bacterium]|nr:dTDP-4-dehydrorhamnose 3,5-epimerase [Clostridia bacterium]
MKKIETALSGCYVIEPQVFGDARGWFYESYSKARFSEIGIDTVFVQDNRSFSAQKGTLRGLHCQTDPHAQTKLICCTRGSLLDVVVDVREGSPSFMQHIRIELSAENKRMLYIPKGFLHGFLTLTDDVEVFYKVDDFYYPENDRSVRYCDPAFSIEWGVASPVLSVKDSTNALFSESDIHFTWE